MFRKAMNTTVWWPAEIIDYNCWEDRGIIRANAVCAHFFGTYDIWWCAVEGANGLHMFGSGDAHKQYVFVSRMKRVVDNVDTISPEQSVMHGWLCLGGLSVQG